MTCWVWKYTEYENVVKSVSTITMNEGIKSCFSKYMELRLPLGILKTFARRSTKVLFDHWNTELEKTVKEKRKI